MAKKEKDLKEETNGDEDKVEDKEMEKKPGDKPTTAKTYDVFDIKGNLLNIYEDKKVAETVAAKEAGRTVAPSPKERTSEDVRDSHLKLKAARLKQLEESNPGHYTP